MTCINTILYIAHGSSEIVVVFLSKLIFLADNVLKVGGSGCPPGRPESNIARACCLNHRTRGSTDLPHSYRMHRFVILGKYLQCVLEIHFWLVNKLESRLAASLFQ